MTFVDAVEIAGDEFKAAIESEFPFAEHPSAQLLYWDFADMHYVAAETPTWRVVTWCGKREDCVWTRVERLDVDRALGLDTVASLRGDDSYPPSTGGSWTSRDFADRIALEGKLLRTHLGACLDATDVFESEGSALEADALLLADPEAVFIRGCLGRFAPLEVEWQLARELDQMGSAVIYRGDSISFRICLLETSCDDEDDLDWSVDAELIETSGTVIPPLFSGKDLEITPRSGPFTLDYLEESFDEIERKVRAQLERSRARV